MPPFYVFCTQNVMGAHILLPNFRGLDTMQTLCHIMWPNHAISISMQ
jgi:hypothetical protein